jgi:hypothetical protein
MRTTEQLAEIESHGGIFTSLKDTRLILKIEEADWTDEDQDAYDRGWKAAESQHWMKISDTALNGSAPAQALIVQRMKDQALKNVNG